MLVGRRERGKVPFWVRSWLFVPLLSLLSAGCFTNSSNLPLSPGASGPLQVVAASDLQLALPALVDKFNQQTPTFQVVQTFGSSGQIAEQIKAGAPFDMFLCANEAYVRNLAKDNHIQPESVAPFAIGSLVLAVHPESVGKVTTLADLAKPEIKKIAIASPEFAPYGVAAKTALERSGLWSVVEPKIVRGESVRQALEYVESGNVEAALVGKSLMKDSKAKLIEVDPKLYDPLVQFLGIVQRSRNKTAANIFLRFLQSNLGAEVLKDSGFQIPDAKSTPTPAKS